MTDLTLFDTTAGTAAGVSVEPAARHGSAAIPGAGPHRAERATAAPPNAGSDGTRGEGTDAGLGVDSTTGTDSRVGAGLGIAGGDAVGRVAGRLEALLVELRSVGGELLEERLGLVGRCEAGLAAVRSETVAELARRDGEARAAEAVRDRLRQSRGSAKRDVKLAGQLADLPNTSQALADGAITAQHARIIAEAAEHTAVDEAALLTAAEREPTDVFGHTVRDHVNEKSADEDLQERRRRQRARRELSISRHSDGMYKLFGLFDPVAGARIDTALTAAAKKLRHHEDPTNRATVPQRYADALERLATANSAAGSQSTTFLVVAEYDAVAGRLAGARLADGTPLVADELVKLAVEAKVLPAIFDVAGRPLWLGRASRDANDAQRIALAARDRRCVGCGTRYNLCEPHHVVHWEHGGPTDIENLCLLCGDCHHNQVHTKGACIESAANGKHTLRHPRRDACTHSRATTAKATVNQPLRR